MGLNCLAQSDPLIIKEPEEPNVKPRRFVRVKPSIQINNGIENIAFENTEELEKISKKDNIQSGVRRKSPNENQNSESNCVRGGTKKKVRPNINGKSPNKEYYQIWTAENPKVENVEENCEEAPPLPPRSLHRPLERSNAFPVPPVLRHQKPKKVLKPEDSFGFELIDVDEPLFEKTFLEDEKKSPKKTIGSDNYITTFVPKKISSPKIIETQSNCSSSSEEALDIQNTPKTHKPLSRQVSNASKFDSPKDTPKKLTKKLSTESSSSDSDRKDTEITNNLTGTPLYVPKRLEKNLDTSLASPLHLPTNKKEPSLPTRPHPKALARVAGIANNLPVCPPTPTHHARRLRNKEAFKPPTLKSFENPPEFEIVTSPEIKHADIRSIDTLDGYSKNQEAPKEVEEPNIVELHRTLTKASWSLKVDGIDTRPPDVRSQESIKEAEDAEQASGGLPLPLRHLTSTRLPSIPERNPRIITLDNNEEPLPPCKLIILEVPKLFMTFCSFVSLGSPNGFPWKNILY